MTGAVIQQTAMFLMRPWIGSCSATLARLSDHLEHDLPRREERRVARHLARCRRCRAVFESLVRAVDQVRSLGRVELSGPMPSAVEPVLERIRHERE